MHYKSFLKSLLTIIWACFDPHFILKFIKIGEFIKSLRTLLVLLRHLLVLLRHLLDLRNHLWSSLTSPFENFFLSFFSHFWGLWWPWFLLIWINLVEFSKKSLFFINSRNLIQINSDQAYNKSPSRQNYEVKKIKSWSKWWSNHDEFKIWIMNSRLNNVEFKTWIMNSRLQSCWIQDFNHVEFKIGIMKNQYSIMLNSRFRLWIQDFNHDESMMKLL